MGYQSDEEEDVLGSLVTLTQPNFAGGLGFRDIEMFNDVLLAEIGWRIIRIPSSLVARVLLGNYA